MSAIAATPAAADDSARRGIGSLRTKLLYGFGSVAFGVKDQGFSYFLLFFYNQVVGAPSQIVGRAIAIALFVDAFADPIIGQLSDNLRTRWGRRHPFMYASVLPVTIAYFFCGTRRTGHKPRCLRGSLESSSSCGPSSPCTKSRAPPWWPS